MAGDGVFDEVLGCVEGARAVSDGAVVRRHVGAPAQASDRDVGRGVRLGRDGDGSGLGSGPSPRVARAPSAGGTPAFSRGR